MLKPLDIVGLSVTVEWQTGVVVPIFKKGDWRVCSKHTAQPPWKSLFQGAGKEAPANCRCTSPRLSLVTILFVIFMDRISRCSRSEESVRFGDLRIASLLFADDVVLWATSDRDLAAECEAVGMRVSTSKSEAMVLCQKTVECSLLVGSELLLQVKEFKYLWVLFTSEGKMEWEMDRLVQCLHYAGAVPVCCGKEGAEPEGKAFDLLVHLHSNPHLWSRALGSDQKNEITDTSGRNVFPLQGGSAQP